MLTRPPQMANKPQAITPNSDRLPVVQANAEQVTAQATIARFRGRPVLLTDKPYPHYVPLRRELFDELAYPLLGGISRSRMGDIFAYVSHTAEDLSADDHLILFGLDDPQNALYAESNFYYHQAQTRVWDMQALEWVDSPQTDRPVWRSPYGVVSQDTDEPLPFIMQLAGGDRGLYDDIMQSLAPLVMDTKPDGVIWWVGDGANGKSTLMDAIYRIFLGQLSSLTVKRLTDQRDTPSLNGTLANIVKESSEGRVDDTEVYKAIGTHENFRVHRFHTQDDVEIRGNMHHIFSANSIPSFNDKGHSARRRTFIVPFTQRFASDPGFEARTFTPEFFGRLIAEMCKYAKRLKQQHYRYKWSGTTTTTKADYDTEANNAEEYAKFLISDGAVAFDNFRNVQNDYNNWCAENGYVPLGITNVRRAMQVMGFERTSTRKVLNYTQVRNVYKLRTVGDVDLQPLAPLNLRPGFFTTPGFRPEPEKPADSVVPDFDDKPTVDTDNNKREPIIGPLW